ncbi:MAG: hypothetical protein NT030_05440 [Candidatus Saganbacteria bacterium]|nr:hypothetical protein [Candidatus Saganbacteria bacterium]
MRKIYLISIFLLCYLTACISSAHAFSLNLNPPSVRLTVGTGESTSGKITLENRGDSKLSVKAYVEDWVYAKDGSKDFKEAGSTPYSCAKWITLSQEKFDLNPKEVKEIEYTLTVPMDETGGHYAVIFFESLIEQAKAQGVAVAGRIGTIVYQETKGLVNKKGSILDLKASSYEKAKPLRVEITFKNEGNTQLQADGKLSLLDSSGNKVVEIEVPRIYSLPGDTAGKDLVFSKIELKKGRYILKGALEYGGAEKATLEKEIVI